MHPLNARSLLDRCRTAPGVVAACSPGSTPAQGLGRKPGGGHTDTTCPSRAEGSTWQWKDPPELSQKENADMKSELA